MVITVQQMAASRTQGVVRDLIAAAQATQPDKLAWVPTHR